MFFWRRRPRIHYYTAAWNEALMLPFMLRHYAPWVERYVIYDHGSTDGTLELLRQHPKVEVRTLAWTHEDSKVATLQDLHNTCWKESRGTADWVIMADVDEFLYHPDFLGYLRRSRGRGVTCVPALGYEMVSDRFPPLDAPLTATVRRGVQTSGFSKLRLFDPAAVEETNFAAGGHRADPTGRIVYPKKDKLLLLHFKRLGLDYLLQRNAMLRARRRPRDIANDWSIHYEKPDVEVVARQEQLLAGAVDVIALGEGAWRTHKLPRWWRPEREASRVEAPAQRDTA